MVLLRDSGADGVIGSGELGAVGGSISSTPAEAGGELLVAA